MAGSDEAAVAGVTGGLLDPGDSVTWRASHFGVPLELTAQVTAFDRPAFFRDEQVAGPFASLVHDHYFHGAGAGRTRMVDEFAFHAPFGPVGRAVDALVLQRYLRRLLTDRARFLKRVAESDDWRQYR